MIRLEKILDQLARQRQYINTSSAQVDNAIKELSSVKQPDMVLSTLLNTASFPSTPEVIALLGEI